MSDTLDTVEKYLPKSLARNILAVILGLIVGGMINSMLIKFGSTVIPAPAGVDPMDIESMRANVEKYTPSHFAVPFLAHALGTLIGAIIAAKIGSYSQRKLSLIIGIFYLIGGTAMAFMIPEFWKYSIFDLLFAYIPMAILGWKIAGSPNDSKS